MSVADDARAAAALIERDGWIQGNMGPTNPEARAPRCLAGAALAAVGGDYGGRRHADLRDALLDALGGVWLLSPWNDELGRTQDDVLALLAAVAGP